MDYREEINDISDVSDIFVLSAIIAVLSLAMIFSPCWSLWAVALHFLPFWVIVAMAVIIILSSLIFGLSLQHRSTALMLMAFGVGFAAAAVLMVYEILLMFIIRIF